MNLSYTMCFWNQVSFWIAHVFDVSFSSPLEGLCRDLIFPSLKLQYLLRLVTSNGFFVLNSFSCEAFFCILSIDIILDYVFLLQTFFFHTGYYNTWKLVLFSGKSFGRQFACAVYFWIGIFNVVTWFKGRGIVLDAIHSSLQVNVDKFNEIVPAHQILHVFCLWNSSNWQSSLDHVVNLSLEIVRRIIFILSQLVLIKNFFSRVVFKQISL
jgi:hypothetical protein